MLHGGHTLNSEEDKATVAFQFFDRLISTPVTHVNSINLEELDLPRLQLSEFGGRFTEEEVWKVIRNLPTDKALAPDDFTARFSSRCGTLSG
jgi:hypothetical protein